MDYKLSILKTRGRFDFFLASAPDVLAPTTLDCSLPLHLFTSTSSHTPPIPPTPSPPQQAQRAAGGMGLGLYSLSKRMEALGGLCGVHDRNDGLQGSVFWFTFPYLPDPTAAQRKNRDSVKNRLGPPF